jgi:phosphate transport system permease protein
MSIKTRYLTQNMARILVWVAALSTLGVMILILFEILRKGLPVLSLEFFLKSPKSMGREGGIFTTIIGTIALTAVAIFFGAPLGVGTAVFLREYTGEGRLRNFIRFGTDCLAGVPSIIFGLFGFVFFCHPSEHGMVRPLGGVDTGCHDLADDHQHSRGGD